MVEIFIVFVTALLAQAYSFLIASELSLLNGLGLLMIGCASLLGLQMLHLWDSKRPHFRISMYVTHSDLTVRQRHSSPLYASFRFLYEI